MLTVPLDPLVSVDDDVGNVYVDVVLISNALSFEKVVKSSVAPPAPVGTSKVPSFVKLEVSVNVPPKPGSKVPELVTAPEIVMLGTDEPVSPLITVYADGMFPLMVPSTFAMNTLSVGLRVQVGPVVTVGANARLVPIVLDWPSTPRCGAVPQMLPPSIVSASWIVSVPELLITPSWMA